MQRLFIRRDFAQQKKTVADYGRGASSRLNDEMKVIRHQRVGANGPAVAARDHLEQFEKVLTITIIESAEP